MTNSKQKTQRQPPLGLHFAGEFLFPLEKGGAGPLFYCLAVCCRSLFNKLTSTRVLLAPLVAEALPMPIT